MTLPTAARSRRCSTSGWSSTGPARRSYRRRSAARPRPAAARREASYERALREHGAEVVDALRRIAPEPVAVTAPQDVPALIEALALGVDAAAGIGLLEPFE
jgi:hypothetical protein